MDVKHVATFSTTTYERDVAAMRAARETLHTRGERVWRETGTLDPMVDIRGGKMRVSRNSMVRRDDAIVLPNGIALPVFAGFDGTGSMAPNIGHAFDALGRLHGILAPLSARYNVQMATGVVQDVDDRRPVVQFTQFESSTLIADWIRLLTPDKSGGDNTEDYDLLMAYLMLGVQADISQYGLKGYAMVVGDEIGRDFVTQENVMEHLGLTLQASRMSTHDICQTLLKSWHLFYVQVSTGGSYLLPETTAFWTRNMGPGRVVVVTRPEFLAEVQAGLLYVTETAAPTIEGFVEFITAGGGNKIVGAAEARMIWQWIVDAGVPFGAQTLLPGYADIPLPGAVFAHYRHPWPIGHTRAGENPELVDDGADLSALATVSAGTPTPTSAPKPIDWSKL